MNNLGFVGSAATRTVESCFKRKGKGEIPGTAASLSSRHHLGGLHLFGGYRSVVRKGKIISRPRFLHNRMDQQRKPLPIKRARQPL